MTGCSSLGLSLYPTGHFLTSQAEEVLEAAPRRANLPRELEASVLPTHYLQPGDVLLIEPVDFDSDIRFPADQKVLADGTVDLSKYGRIIVAGMSLEASEQAIENLIVAAGDDASQINVRLLEPVHRYYVLGEVASPGSYPLTGFETVLDGIMAAGGLASKAAPCKILLSRPTPPPSCRIVLPICYREITQLGDATTNYQLQPGDRIYVSSRGFAEEFFFWRANRTCDRCCNRQVPCCDPVPLGFRNPLAVFLPANPPRPTGLEMNLSDNEKMAPAPVVKIDRWRLPNQIELPTMNPPGQESAAEFGELEFLEPIPAIQ
jgi:protein involved in polysaccharide export with SLBB domain